MNCPTSCVFVTISGLPRRKASMSRKTRERKEAKKRAQQQAADNERIRLLQIRATRNALAQAVDQAIAPDLGRVEKEIARLQEKPSLLQRVAKAVGLLVTLFLVFKH